MDERVPDGVYLLVNAGSGKVLDVPGGGRDNGVSVEQWERLGPRGSRGQQWSLCYDADHGAYVVRRPDVGKYLDVCGGSLENGASVQVWEYTSSDAQRWLLRPDARTGRYAVVNVGSGRVLDVADGSRADGANVQQWDDRGAAGQRWEFVPVG
ncbi:RICIN domain-containing protein [Streptomyces sp. NPDC050560]|uniref:RICIN domain-containing protein n=1 Tax=Streptomyces sp. NPDC050560 TaxID=3365630 RepID=UPI00379B7CBA